jgi:hypothetical protein
MSINEMMSRGTSTASVLFVIGIVDNNFVALTSVTGWEWIEVVIIAVLTPSESFVVVLDVLEVIFASNTRVLEFVRNTDFTT